MESGNILLISSLIVLHLTLVTKMNLSQRSE